MISRTELPTRRKSTGTITATCRRGSCIVTVTARALRARSRRHISTRDGTARHAPDLSSARMPEKRYLVTPGPTPVPPEVLAATAAPMIHHRGPDFRATLARVLERLGQVFRTENDILLYASAGTGTMESAVSNLCSPGDRVLVVSHGYFGERFAAMARRTVPSSHTFGMAGARRRVPMRWGTGSRRSAARRPFSSHTPRPRQAWSPTSARSPSA